MDVAAPEVDLASLAHTVLSAVAHGVWQAVTTSPLLGVLAAAVVIAGVARAVRRAMYSSWDRDDVRLFSRADKRAILARAGGRCEHHFVFFGRCKTTTELQADHIHPWSRGGHTVLANGQALCERHNQEKHAAVPFNRQLRKIERRRLEYFPPGEIATVRRRAALERSAPERVA